MGVDRRGSQSDVDGWMSGVRHQATQHTEQNTSKARVVSARRLDRPTQALSSAHTCAKSQKDKSLGFHVV